MSAERNATKSRRVTIASIALFFSLGVGLVVACGSDAENTNGGPNGNDAGEAGPSSGFLNDSGNGTSGNLPDGNVVELPDSSIPDECANPITDPSAIDCTGKCGPVRDRCSGLTRQCGGCETGQVCDLSNNGCTAPKTSCADLGAECGTLKNTCGVYLDCPDGANKGCPDGKECDPDTNKCRDCQPVTCADIGIECGSAWLGCGIDKPENRTDCGSCANDAQGNARVCNNQFHTCEPKCTPKTAAQLCADAKTKKGVECGVISNGCGGTVSCDSVPTFGCKSGESCGVRGIANRCDPAPTPDECVALGHTCGQITSACTGQKINCGQCSDGQVCNANGVCGTPCQPKTCADFADKECGNFDDTCGGTVTCGGCAGGVCVNNACCKSNTCPANFAGKCGDKLPLGCGGANSLNCDCTGTNKCTLDGGAASAPALSSTGICCTPHAATFYSNQSECGTNLPDGCGGTIATVNCANGGVCVDTANGTAGNAPKSGIPGTCCTRDANACKGQDPLKCAAVQDTCRPTGTLINCNGNCSGTGTTTSCFGGACCTPPGACSLNGAAGGECNDSKPANGCGTDRPCNCGNNLTCWCTDHQCVPKTATGGDGAGLCKAANQCGTTYAGKCGTKLDNGIGNTMDCKCGGGMTCSESQDGKTGTCACSNGLGRPYKCAEVLKNGDACGTFDDGCGASVTCGCTTGGCDTAATPNKCCTPSVCPAKALGSACGTISNGCDSTNNCSCPSGTGNENFTCAANKCACVPDTCHGRTGPQPDRCGGTLQCGG